MERKTKQLAFAFASGQKQAENIISIHEAAIILSVSPATVRNWIKTGLLRSRKRGRRIALAESDVLGLKKSIVSGENGRLKSRRNKRSKRGNYVPANYVSRQRYADIAAMILDVAAQMTSRVKRELILAEISLKLLVGCGKIKLDPCDSTTYVEDFTNPDNNPGLYGKLVRDLMPLEQEFPRGDIELLRHISELEVPFYPGEDLLGLIYMALNNLDVRKVSGSYYTPSIIVDKLVDQCLGSGMDREQKIVDPCCGSGNFLLKLFLKLRQSLTNRGVPPIDAEREALGNLYGYDIDPTAIALARLNLALASEHKPNLTLLCSQVVPRNSLLHDWGNYSFDLVIGNPPWGYSFSEEELADLATIYDSAISGESFSLFVNLGLRLLKPNGVLAYVLPQSLLNVKLHETVRRLLLSETEIEHIAILGNSLFGKVYAPALTLKARKKKPAPSHKVEVWAEDTIHAIPQTRFAHNQLAIFNIKSTAKEQAILEKMKRVRGGAMYLKGHAVFALGVVTGNNKAYVYRDKPEGGEQILKGSDIFKYNFYPSGNYIIFRPDKFQQVAPIELYRAPEKLIYRFINERLIFAYDDKQTLSLNSANIVIPDLQGYSLKYILAVLNSSCAQFFFTLSFSSVKVLRRHLESIPIPPCEPHQQGEIIGYVEEMLQTHGAEQRKRLHHCIDELVFKLFELDQSEAELIKRAIPQSLFLYR